MIIWEHFLFNIEPLLIGPAGIGVVSSIYDFSFKPGCYIVNILMDDGELFYLQELTIGNKRQMIGAPILMSRIVNGLAGRYRLGPIDRGHEIVMLVKNASDKEMKFEATLVITQPCNIEFAKNWDIE